MKLNLFGREIALKKEAVVVGAAILLLLGCLVGYVFLRDDNDIIIEAGSGPATEASTGAAISPGGSGAEPSGSTPDTAAAGVSVNDSAAQADGTICIYVVGCVKQPGIVTIKKGQLINDAVKAAGGLTSDADAENINLVYSLNENVMLNIKSRQEPGQANADLPGQTPGNVSATAGKQASAAKQDNTGTQAAADRKASAALGSGAEIVSESGSAAIIAGGSAAGGSEVAAGDGKNLVNINTAGADELDTLPGVGEATARDIIAFREKNGKFGSIEDIMKVPRIKQNRFDSIKDFITVD